MTWPLAASLVRLLWLRALWVVATCADAAGPCTVVRCAVATWLRDTRLSAFPGRQGLPRSLGSVYACLVARFLGGQLRGTVVRKLHHDVQLTNFGDVAMVDSATFVSCSQIYHYLDVYRSSDGKHIRRIGQYGAGKLEFRCPVSVTCTSDACILTLERQNSRVQVLTTQYEFHSFLGEGMFDSPTAMCANDVVVVVLDSNGSVAVLSRASAALIARFCIFRNIHFGSMCLMPDGQHIVIVEQVHHRVRVHRLDGELVRCFGRAVLNWPATVRCSAFGEILVVDNVAGCVQVFDPSGDLVQTLICKPDVKHPWHAALHLGLLYVFRFDGTLVLE